ncbi:MAG: hypothetical protein GY862_35010 [Gammaproteobacteria bacterium]|nr:hypothetical protein [Gammaproteobacteria bacterium]
METAPARPDPVADTTPVRPDIGAKTTPIRPDSVTEAAPAIPDPGYKDVYIKAYETVPALEQRLDDYFFKYNHLNTLAVIHIFKIELKRLQTGILTCAGTPALRKNKNH